jgi:predicted molibdopterin-dependent oxidoreductase YjgC
MHVKDNRFIRATAHERRWNEQPNKGMLCLKGRFGLDFVQAGDRLRTPMVRMDGKLVPCSWDEALDYTAERLKAVKSAHGPNAIGFFLSAKVTNEENYALMRFARAVIGTHNIDHCARL